MLTRMQRHVGVQHPANLMAPHARAVHHMLTGDLALLTRLIRPLNGGDAAALAGDASRLGALLHHSAALAGALRQSQRDVRRVALPVQRQIDACGHVVDIQMRVAVLHLRWRDFLNLNPKRAGHRGLAENLFLTLFGQRGSDGADAFEARRNTRLCFQTAIKFLRILRQLGHVRRRAQLRDQARRVPCRA